MKGPFVFTCGFFFCGHFDREWLRFTWVPLLTHSPATTQNIKEIAHSQLQRHDETHASDGPHGSWWFGLPHPSSKWLWSCRTLSRSTEIDLLSTTSSPEELPSIVGTPRPKDPESVGLFPIVQKLIFSVQRTRRGAPKHRGDTSPQGPGVCRTPSRSTEIDLLSTTNSPEELPRIVGTPRPKDPESVGLFPVVQNLPWPGPRKAKGQKIIK